MSPDDTSTPETDVDWQERIASSSSPVLLVEHALRYQAAIPVLEASSSWVDLGTGAGVAAALAVSRPPSNTVLVDVEPLALAEAARRFPNAQTEVMDLCDAGHLERLVEVLATLPAPVAVTAFEVVEHLSDHTALLGALLEAVRTYGITVVLSVPNDAFTGVENPYHLVKWGADSFEELLAVLPSERAVARQVTVSGSAIYLEGSEETPRIEQPIVVGDGVAPSHLLVAFGPLHTALRPAAEATAADTVSMRAWERQREADLAYYQAKTRELPALEQYVREMEHR